MSWANRVYVTDKGHIWDFDLNKERDCGFGYVFLNLFDWLHEFSSGEFEGSYDNCMTTIDHILKTGGEDVTARVEELRSQAYYEDVENDWWPEVSAEDYKEWVNASCGIC